MIRCTLTFFGEELDGHGMPKPFHHYLILASQWQTESSAIASIVPISLRAPMPPKEHFVTEYGGPEAAVAAASEALARLPENRVLQQHSTCR